jgi:hypothetical protein
VLSALRSSSTAQLAALAVVLLVASGCEDDDASPTGPTPVATSPAPGAGANEVGGTERLGWSVSGDTSRLRFRAYVDGAAVDLPSATCNGGECSSPLPAMSNGTHTITVVAVSTSGVEGDRSAPITIQKVSARATVSSLALASAFSGFRLDPVVTIADGLSFTADIVATGVRAPAQLSWLPDGRLLLAEADGRVRVVRPGGRENRDPALETGMLAAEQLGPMGIATHPNFAQNRLVYVSLLERGRAGDTRLRLLRLREIGDTLGEPATLFDAPVAATAAQPGERLEVGAEAQAGPRMAFGPDRLLYVMLPPGVEFVNEPAASTPRASMLRLSDDGRAASEPLSGITASPLAFTWHETSGALWVLFRGENGDAAVRSLDGRARVLSAEPARLRVRESMGASSGTLLLQSAPDDLLVARALVGTRADGSKGMLRLALPAQADRGTSDRIGDVVAGDGGMLFAVTNNALHNGDAGDVVVRLTPVQTK